MAHELFVTFERANLIVPKLVEKRFKSCNVRVVTSDCASRPSDRVRVYRIGVDVGKVFHGIDVQDTECEVSQMSSSCFARSEVIQICRGQSRDSGAWLYS